MSEENLDLLAKGREELVGNDDVSIVRARNGWFSVNSVDSR